MSEINLIDFETLKSKLTDFVVVDVRGKEEIIRDGQIPGSHSVPIAEIATAVDLSDSEFQSKYGFKKPSSEAPIVTHCHGGGRALRSATAFMEKGFSNVRCYKGSLKDWVENGGDLIKPGKPYESS